MAIGSGAISRLVSRARSAAGAGFSLVGVVIKSLNRPVSVSGVGFSLAGVVVRLVSAARGVGGAGFSLAGAVVRGLVARVRAVAGTASIFTGAVVRFASRFRTSEGAGFSFSGVVAGVKSGFSAFARSVTGELSSVLGVVVARISAKSLSGTLSLSGVVTKAYTVLKRSASGEGMSFAGVVEYYKGAFSTYARSAGGSFSSAGVVTRMVSRGRSVGGNITARTKYCDGYKEAMPYGVVYQ